MLFPVLNLTNYLPGEDLFIRFTNYVPGEGTPSLSDKVKAWNSNLTEFVQNFREKHTDAYIEIYDSASLFTKVMDNPDHYGFIGPVDICTTGKCLWADHIHPSSAFHKVIAQDIASFMDGFENRFWVWRSEAAVKPIKL